MPLNYTYHHIERCTFSVLGVTGWTCGDSTALWWRSAPGEPVLPPRQNTSQALPFPCPALWVAAGIIEGKLRTEGRNFTKKSYTGVEINLVVKLLTTDRQESMFWVFSHYNWAVNSLKWDRPLYPMFLNPMQQPAHGQPLSKHYSPL